MHCHAARRAEALPVPGRARRAAKRSGAGESTLAGFWKAGGAASALNGHLTGFDKINKKTEKLGRKSALCAM